MTDDAGERRRDPHRPALVAAHREIHIAVRHQGAALPLDEPPALRAGSHGLRTGAGHDVKLAPEKQRFSHTDFPATLAPASSGRVTTVASRAGTNPSTDDEPFAIGTPDRKSVV